MEKERKIYRMEITLFILLLYGTTVSVFLNGDDFMYGTFAHEGILSAVWDYYHTGNGRFWINILDSVLLWFNRYLYILVTPWIVLAFVWLLVRNVELILGYENNEEKHQTFMKYGMVLFACMDVMCLRETVYWITGMMNYLFPAVIFLLGYYCFQKSRLNSFFGWKVFAYTIICFFAASSVEQYALMFVGMLTLQHGYDMICKKRIPTYEWIAFAVSLIGLACLIFAPGNFVRINDQSKIQPPFVDNFWTLIVYDTMECPPFPYFLMLFMLIGKSVLKDNNIKNSVILVAGSIFVLSSWVPILKKAFIYIVYISLFFGAMFITFKKNKYPFPFYALLFVGIGSQMMLLISAIWGFRCMFSLYMVYMMLIIMLMDQLEENEKTDVLLSGVSAAICPVLTVIFWVIEFFHVKFKKYAWSVNIKKIFVLAGCFLLMLSVSIGYGMNVSTYHKNITETKSGNQEIVLQPVPQFECSWYHIPFDEFHEVYYKYYYGIENSTITYSMSKETKIH